MMDGKQTGTHIAIKKDINENTGSRRSVTGSSRAFGEGGAHTASNKAVSDYPNITAEPAKPEKGTQTGRGTAAHADTAARDAAKPAGKKHRPNKRTIFIIAIAAAAILIVLVAIALRSATDEKRYSEYYRQGQQCYDAGDYGTALSYLRKAAAVDRTDKCLFLMADCYVAQNKPEKGLEILSEMDAGNPSVAQKIQQLKELIAAKQSADMVEINGSSYRVDTTGLSLDAKSITNDSLTQIAKLYALSNLSLADNSITDISALSVLGGLTTLNISRNAVTDLTPLSGLSCLRTLYLDGNPITDFTPLYTLTSLTTLSIKNIEIDANQKKALSAALPNCAIHSEALSDEDLDISLGGMTFKTSVTSLDLSNMSISDISALSACKELTWLNLSGNSISDLSPLMDIPNLETLNISANNVEDLRPLMGISSLTALNASDNRVYSTVALGSLSKLKELQLSNNPLSDISAITKLHSLETLYLNNTGLNDDELAQLTSMYSLRLLNIEDNAELTMNSVEQLEKSLKSCTVTHSQLPYIIEVGGQKFYDNATEINLNNCAVTDLSFLSSFKNLETVMLSGNGISNVYIFEWIDGIKYLDLSNNNIDDITAVASMAELETLNVSNNNISAVTPFMSLTNLKQLYLSGNNISEEDRTKLCMALPNCNIYFE